MSHVKVGGIIRGHTQCSNFLELTDVHDGLGKEIVFSLQHLL